jgi:hypothetical protein
MAHEIESQGQMQYCLVFSKQQPCEVLFKQLVLTNGIHIGWLILHY